MNFDVTTAVPVREREDGLMEEDVFDVTTALPVDPVTHEPLSDTFGMLEENQISEGMRMKEVTAPWVHISKAKLAKWMISPLNIQNAKPPTFIDKVKSLFRESSDDRIVRSQNAHWLSELSGVPQEEIEKNWDYWKLHHTKYTGLPRDPTYKEVMSSVAALPLAATVAEVGVVPTALALGGTMLFAKYLNVSQLVPKDANDFVKKSAEIIDTVAQVLVFRQALMSSAKYTPAIGKFLTKNIIEEYNLPRTIKLTGEQVKDVFQTGKLTTAEQKDALSSLGLSSKQYRLAIKNGVELEVPVEKITTTSSKPYWSKILKAFGQEDIPVVMKTTPGKVTQGAPKITFDPANEPTIGDATKFVNKDGVSISGVITGLSGNVATIDMGVGHNVKCILPQLKANEIPDIDLPITNARILSEYITPGDEALNFDDKSALSEALNQELTDEKGMSLILKASGLEGKVIPDVTAWEGTLRPSTSVTIDGSVPMEQVEQLAADINYVLRQDAVAISKPSETGFETGIIDIGRPMTVEEKELISNGLWHVELPAFSSVAEGIMVVDYSGELTKEDLSARLTMVANKFNKAFGTKVKSIDVKMGKDSGKLVEGEKNGKDNNIRRTTAGSKESTLEDLRTRADKAREEFYKRKQARGSEEQKSVEPLPEDIQKKISKGEPISPEVVEKTPALKSDKYVYNTEEGIASAEEIRPKVVEAQKEVMSIVAEAIESVPGLKTTEEYKKFTPETLSKQSKSLASKVARRHADNKKDFTLADIQDGARDTIIVKDVKSLPKLFDFLASKGKFTLQIKLVNPHKSGFMGTYFNHTTSNGVKSEIQLVLDDSGWNLKLETEKDYHVFRMMNLKKLSWSEKTDYFALVNATHAKWTKFFASKGYTGGSLRELESFISRSASSSGITVESSTVDIDKSGSTQSPALGENAFKPLSNTRSSVSENASSAKPISTTSLPNKNIPQSTKNVKSGRETTGLSQSVADQALKKEIVVDLEQLPEANVRNMADAAQRALDVIESDINLAKKIAFLESPEVNNVRAQEMFTALRKKAFADGDVELINELATNEAAGKMGEELGQRIKALDTGETNDPVRVLQDINKSLKIRAKKPAIIKEKKMIIEKLKKSVKKSIPKKDEWDSFIEGLRC